MLSKTDFLRCLGFKTTAVELGYSCLNPAKPVVDVIQDSSASTSEKGLVRLHDRHGHIEGQGYAFEIVAPDTKPYIMLQAVKFHLDIDYTLSIRNSCHYGEEFNQNNHNKTIKGNAETVVFEFTTTSSIGNNNVQFCFQWFKGNDPKNEELFKETLEKCKKKASGIEQTYIIKPDISQHRSGVVRSHPLFPYHYPRPYYQHLCDETKRNKIKMHSSTASYR